MSGKRYEAVKYRKLQHSDTYTEEQFKRPKRAIPWKAITFSFALFTMGSTALSAACLILAGFLDSPRHQESLWPLLILGILAFIPGAYHLRLAYYAMTGKAGYSMDDFPEFE